MEYEKLVGDDSEETSDQVRQRVESAREIQRRRFRDMAFTCNAEMGPAEVWSFCQLEEGAKGLLQAAMKQLDLSAQGLPPHPQTLSDNSRPGSLS